MSVNTSVATKRGGLESTVLFVHWLIKLMLVWMQKIYMTWLMYTEKTCKYVSDKQWVMAELVDMQRKFYIRSRNKK